MTTNVEYDWTSMLSESARTAQETEQANRELLRTIRDSILRGDTAGLVGLINKHLGE